ncbi:hypothetical protein C0J52_25532 [Blattella germanica]|nr:hypothetical protein C0J52_25532 [Blattella germanica]
MRKICVNYASKYGINNNFPLRSYIHDYSTQNISKLDLPSNRLRKRNKSYKFLSIKFLNMLPLQNLHDALLEYLWENTERQAFQRYLNLLFKNHHLLRTYQIPGIYSIKISKELSPLEQRMTTFKFKNFMIRRHREHRQQKEKLVASNELIFKGHLQRCERFWRESLQSKGKYLSGSDIYRDSIEIEKESKMEKKFGLARMKFSLSKPKDEVSIFTFEKPSKIIWRESDPSKNISDVPFITQIKQITYFDDLLKCEYVHNKLSSTKLEFYTKQPPCTCFVKPSKKS